MKNLTTLFTVALCAVISGTAFATPAISNLSLSQDASSKTVFVNYDLSEDAIVTMDVLTNGASIGPANVRFLAGDVQRRVSGGTGRRIFWAAERSWPGHDASQVSVQLTAWTLSSPPPYMVVSLSKGDECTYYVSEDSLPGGIGNPLYRTGSIVMRKIPANGVVWQMGTSGGAGYETPRRVTFTGDYWLSVFEVTHGQQQFLTRIGGATLSQDPDTVLRPVDTASYSACRGGAQTSGGTEATGDGSRWPDEGHEIIGNNSIVGLFRGRTGLMFDLPTSAEWEYACRAGAGESRYLPDDLGDLAWYSANSPEDGTPKAHPVGTRKPNAWGLYDMYGNVREWVLDRKTEGNYSSADDTDPKGPTIASQSGVNTVTRLLRGGSYLSDAANCRSAAVAEDHGFSGSKQATGLRLACPVE